MVLFLELKNIVVLVIVCVSIALKKLIIIKIFRWHDPEFVFCFFSPPNDSSVTGSPSSRAELSQWWVSGSETGTGAHRRAAMDAPM